MSVQPELVSKNKPNTETNPIHLARDAPVDIDTEHGRVGHVDEPLQIGLSERLAHLVTIAFQFGRSPQLD